MQSLKKRTKESRQFPLVHQGFEIKYEVYPEEDISMVRHFIKECGYSELLGAKAPELPTA